MFYFSVMAGTRHRKERLYHIDDTPSGVAEVIQDLDHTFQVCVKLRYSWNNSNWIEV